MQQIVKLAGGDQLECGHYQVVSPYRSRLASEGYEQELVWCVECSDWSRLIPVQTAREIVQESLDNPDSSVLE